MSLEMDEVEREARTWRRGTYRRRAFLAMATGLAGGAAVSGLLGARRFADDLTAAPAAAQGLFELPSPGQLVIASPPAAQAQTAGTLRIPPLLAPRLQAGVKVFHLALQQGVAEPLPGVTSATLGSTAPIWARRCERAWAMRSC